MIASDQLRHSQVTIEDRFIVESEGWSVCIDMIETPMYDCVHGLKIHNRNYTDYVFYSILNDREFIISQCNLSLDNIKKVDCCRLVEADYVDIGESVLFWTTKPSLMPGKVVKKNGDVCTIKTKKGDAVMDVSDIFVIKFKHEVMNIENCVSKCGCYEERQYASEL